MFKGVYLRWGLLLSFSANRRFAKFHGFTANRNGLTIVTSSGCWAQDPHSKTSERGISEVGFHFYHFQQVNCVGLPSFMIIVICIVNILTYSQYWAQVPSLKIAQGVVLGWGPFFFSFSKSNCVGFPSFIAV